MRIGSLHPKRYTLTPEGKQQLENQLHELKQLRQRVAQEMREITSQSTDRSVVENSMLTIYRNQAADLDGRIALLERIIGLARVITVSKNTRKVQFGSTVTMRLGKVKQTLKLVSSLEADPLQGRVSDESPLGRSLLGRKVGEKFAVLSPRGVHLPATIMAIAA